MSSNEIIYSELPTTTEFRQEWATFCESCFSFKPNPPTASYFINHLEYDDALRSADGDVPCVLTARSKVSDNIIGSARFVHRLLWINGSFKPVIGVADVCVSAEWQRKSIAKTLLTMIINKAKERKSTNIFLLHAAETLQPLYSSVGFRSIDTEWHKLSLSRKCRSIELSILIDSYLVEEKIIESVSLDQMAALSESLTRQCDLSGVLYKSSEYYGSWVRKIPRLTLLSVSTGSDCDHKDQMIAIIGEYRGYLLLRDLGVDNIENMHICFASILRYIQNTHSNISTPIDSPIEIVVPEKLARNIVSVCDLFVHSVAYVDKGWMMLTQDMTELECFYSGSTKFNFWTVDHF